MLPILATITFSHNLLFLTPMTVYLSVSSALINASNNTTMIFVRAGRRFMKHRPVQIFGNPIQEIAASYYLRRPQMNDWPGRLMSLRLERMVPWGWDWVSSPVEENCSVWQVCGPAVQAAHHSRERLCVPNAEIRSKHPFREAVGVTKQVSQPCCLCALVTMIARKWTTTGEYNISPTSSVS